MDADHLNEYDSYLAHRAELLLADADSFKIAAYVRQVVRVSMGISSMWRSAFLFFVGLELLSPGVALPEDAGSLCIAPIEAPRGGEKSLANPSGRNATRAYSVQIDNRPSIAVAADRGTLVEALDLDKSHTVVIYADGLGKATLRLRFGEHRAQCLWFNALYETWSLTPSAGKEKICACQPQR